MKLIPAFLCLILSSFMGRAQNEILPVDEQGKFIYYELVNAKSIKKDQLKESVNSFIKANKNLKLKATQGDTVFIATGKLVINKTVLVMSHPSGEVLYHFQAEIKEGRYRFWLSDFNFIPYQRDRYGNFVATTNRGVPLEANPGKLNAAQWKEYQSQTSRYAIQFAKSFKDAMAGQLPVVTPVKEKAIVKKEW